jgi:hypothetical protein
MPVGGGAICVPQRNRFRSPESYACHGKIRSPRRSLQWASRLLLTAAGRAEPPATAQVAAVAPLGFSSSPPAWCLSWGAKGTLMTIEGLLSPDFSYRLGIERQSQPLHADIVTMEGCNLRESWRTQGWCSDWRCRI